MGSKDARFVAFPDDDGKPSLLTPPTAAYDGSGVTAIG